MVVKKIICDKCLKEIQEDPFTLVPEIVEKDNPEIMKESTYENRFYQDQSKRHYCGSCVEKILYLANHRAAEVNQDFEDAVNDMMYDVANEVERQSGAVSEEDPQVEVSTQQEAAGSEQPAKKNGSEKRGKIDPDELVRFYRSGMSTSDIAEHFGVSFQAVYQRIKKLKKSEDETVFCDESVIKKCEYGANISGGVFCNYLEIEGHSRPCPPEACTCFKNKNGKRRKRKVAGKNDERIPL